MYLGLILYPTYSIPNKECFKTETHTGQHLAAIRMLSTAAFFLMIWSALASTETPWIEPNLCRVADPTSNRFVAVNPSADGPGDGPPALGDAPPLIQACNTSELSAAFQVGRWPPLPALSTPRDAIPVPPSLHSFAPLSDRLCTSATIWGGRQGM